MSADLTRLLGAQCLCPRALYPSGGLGQQERQWPRPSPPPPSSTGISDHSGAETRDLHSPCQGAGPASPPDARHSPAPHQRPGVTLKQTAGASCPYGVPTLRRRSRASPRAAISAVPLLTALPLPAARARPLPTSLSVCTVPMRAAHGTPRHPQAAFLVSPRQASPVGPADQEGPLQSPPSPHLDPVRSYRCLLLQGWARPPCGPCSGSPCA